MFENWGEFLCQLSSIVTLNLCLHFITVIKLSLSLSLSPVGTTGVF